MDILIAIVDFLATAVVFVLIFSVLVLIHEFGHFIMAKRAGIKVEEFGFGLPPRLWGKKKGETIYSINWIPFGGFVRMLGEDATDPNMLKKKRSFIAQPMRARAKVIVAGVVMNFFLAWLLLTIGFVFGMQPLLGPDDILPAVDSGLIELVEGVKIKNVEEGSPAAEIGFKNDDVLFSIDGDIVNYERVLKMEEDFVGIYKVVREGVIQTYEVTDETAVVFAEQSGEESFGLDYFDFAAFPRVKVFNVDKNSATYKAGLQKDDLLISVNGVQIYSVIQFEELIRESNILEYEIYRNGMKHSFIVELKEGRRVIISTVLPGMPASEVGFEDGDVVISVNGVEMTDSEALIEFVAENANAPLAYLIERDGERIFYEVVPEEGKIGVLLSELVTYSGEQDMSLYNADLLSSIDKVNEEIYPVHIAAWRSLGESVRLSKLTARMFVGVVVDLVQDGEIPDGVAGPVGIAQLTHVFVQEGVMSILRFVAILSLSLAVINILPFPALDGGRLFFILVEFVTGRRVNQKWESFIHAIGYVLILLLILAVTYNDILRLFGF